MADTNDFKENFDSDQMFMAGLKMGDILKIFVWGVEEAPTMPIT
jgi:hypothetical protein